MLLGIIPLILAAVVAVAAITTSAVTAASTTKGDKYRKGRIKELKALQEQGLLGLNPQQREQLLDIGMAPLQSRAREVASAEGDLLATQDLGAGRLVNQRRIAEDQLRGDIRDTQVRIEQEDRRQADLQQNELNQLIERQEKSAKAKKDAVINAVDQAANVAGAAITAQTIGAQEGVANGLDSKALTGALGRQSLGQGVGTTNESWQARLKAAGLSESFIEQIAQMTPDQRNQILSAYF
jgi:hypothetical protein